MAAGYRSPLYFLGINKGIQAGFLSPFPLFISKTGPSGPGFTTALPVFFAGATTVPVVDVDAASTVKRIINFGFLGRRM